MKTQHTRIFGIIAKAVLRGNFIAMSAYIKKRVLSNKQPDDTLQVPRRISHS
jgi:hypothetical protein